MLGWALAWLAGTAAVAGYSITRHAPALERLMREDVQEAIAPLAATTDAATVSVSVRDHVATLSGTVASASERDALIVAAGDGLGIRGVVDRLVLLEPEPEPPSAPPSESSPEPSPESESPGSDRPSADAEVESLADELADATAAMPKGGADGSSDGDELPPEDAFETDEASEEELALEEFPTEELPTRERATDEVSESGDGVDGTSISGDGADDETNGAVAGTADAASPALRLDVVDRVLTIEGSLSRDDDAAALVLMAMDSFELDYVSNTLESGSNVPSAPWLAALAELLPVLASLDDPGVDVAGERVTLYGTAPDAATRDAIVTRALADLDGYSLIERIDVADSTDTSVVSTPSSDAGPEGVMADADGVSGGTTPVPVNGDTDSSDADSFGTDDTDADGSDADDTDADSSDAVSAEEAETDVGTDEGDLDPDAEADGTEETDPDTATDAGAPDATIDPDSADTDSAGPDAAESVVDTTGGDAETTGDGLAVPDTDAVDTEAAEGEASAADTVETASDGDTGPADDADTIDPDAADTDAAGTEPSDTEPTRTALLDSGGDASGSAPAPRPEPASSAAALRAALDALPDTRILFEFASATLTGPSGDVVDAIAETLLAHPGVPIAIEGHTDGIGFRERNLELSQRRANAVRDRLVERGVPFERLTSYGYGEGVPVADNASPEGRAANRRIEFTF